MTAESLLGLADKLGAPFLIVLFIVLTVALIIKVARNGNATAPQVSPDLVTRLAEVSGQLANVSRELGRVADGVNKAAADLAILAREQEAYQKSGAEAMDVVHATSETLHEVHAMVTDLHRRAA